MSDERPTSEASGGLPVTRRTWLKTAAFSAALLLSGAAIGSGATVIAMRRNVQRARREPDFMSRRMLERMHERFDLTDEQTVAIRDIFAESREQVQKFRRDQHTRARQFMESVHEDVGDVLTEKQRAQWDRWYARARKRSLRPGPPGAPPGPPPDHRRPHRNPNRPGPGPGPGPRPHQDR